MGSDYALHPHGWSRGIVSEGVSCIAVAFEFWQRHIPDWIALPAGRRAVSTTNG